MGVCRVKGLNAFPHQKKEFDDATLAFAKKNGKDVEDQVESLPSFIIAINARDEHLKMNKERYEANLAEKLREEARTEAMNRFENEQGTGLKSLLSTPIFTPPKISLHSANLTINENPTTIASGASKGGSNDKVNK